MIVMVYLGPPKEYLYLTEKVAFINKINPNGKQPKMYILT